MTRGTDGRWPGDAQRERTTFGALSRGELMARIRSSGNLTTEQRLASLLRDAGLAGWRRHFRVAGRPDFAWRSVKVAVFVDGCFWHGHGHDCGRNLSPRTNVEAWAEKIRRTKERDRKATQRLRQAGWTVVRVWECQLAKDPKRCLDRIRGALPDASDPRSRSLSLLTL
ncbi:MAG: very short patch repair endonuclease [Myxococcales bacterium]|nr:very short patch repair endonuclease [Myxococcales bacterium]